MGKKQLADFLLRLSTDPSALQRYQQDPASAMAEAGLDTADRVALASGNADRLEAYLGEKPATIVKAAIVQGMGFGTPIIQEPAIAPATPIIQQPIVKKPIIKKPIVKKPIIKKPIIKRPKVKPAKKKAAKKAPARKAPAKKTAKKAVKKTTTRIVKRTKVKTATKRSAKKSRVTRKPAARKTVKARKSAKRRPARKK